MRNRHNTHLSPHHFQPAQQANVISTKPSTAAPPLNQFTLKFLDPTTEQEYILARFTQDVAFIRFGLIYRLVPLLSQSVWLYAMYHGSTLTIWHFAHMLSLIPWSIALWLTFSKSPNARTRLYIVAAIFVFVSITLLVAVQVLCDSGDALSGPVIIPAMGSVFFTKMLIRLPFLHSVMSGWSVFIFYTVFTGYGHYYQRFAAYTAVVWQLCVILFLFLIQAYWDERKSRMMFWGERVNGQLNNRITQLQSELEQQQEESSTGTSSIDLDSPMDKVFEVLKQMQDALMDKSGPNNGGANAEQCKVLCEQAEFVMNTLASSENVFAADITQQLQRRETKVDSETAEWLQKEISSAGPTTHVFERQFSSPPVLSHSSSSSSSFRLPTPNSNTTDTPNNTDPTPPTTPQATAHELVLQPTESWNFNAIDAEKQFGKASVLPMVAKAVVKKERFPLIGEKIKWERFWKFVGVCSGLYKRNVPYHNATHAADVLCSLNGLIWACPKAVTECLSEVELFAAFVAAIAHDLCHPGLNNAWHIGTGSSLALEYNDRSVLENMHCSTCFNILKDPTCNFIEGLSQSDKSVFRKTVIDMILATDMNHHLDNLSKWNTRIKSGFDATQADHRNLLLLVLLKAADISNIGKSTQCYLEWTDRLLAEFFAQGDTEKKMGMPVSAFMDRTSSNVPQSQRGFIDYVGVPMFQAVCSFFTTGRLPAQILENLQSNKRHWDNVQSYTPPPPTTHIT